MEIIEAIYWDLPLETVFFVWEDIQKAAQGNMVMLTLCTPYVKKENFNLSQDKQTILQILPNSKVFKLSGTGRLDECKDLILYDREPMATIKNG